MKTCPSFPRRLAPAAAAAFLLFPGVRPARAVFTFTISQVGRNVVVDGSGSINTAALTLSGSFAENGLLGPSTSTLVGGSATLTPSDQYGGGGLAPHGAFGPGGGLTAPTYGSGSKVGYFGASIVLNVPYRYRSGDFLTTNSIYTEETLATLGIVPGEYRITWGAGAAADRIVVLAGVTEPGTWATLAAGGVALAAGRRRGRWVAAAV